ncbi:hypothetical protein [Ruegeria hyattellae]|uniref:hypothetical protein n=1 Tax=Ruegeria hyattellae TaxID=3233337 RepID=UPI00355B8459
MTRQVEHPELQRHEISAAQFQATYNHALEQGIEVDPDHWNDLNATAWPMLVRSDAQCRVGAGPVRGL